MNRPLRFGIALLAAGTMLLSVTPSYAGGGGRGAVVLAPEQQAALDEINNNLAAEMASVATATSNFQAAVYALPKDEAKIVAANTALAAARQAWANKAAAEFARVQATTNKLGDQAIAQLVAGGVGGARRGAAAGPGGGGGGFGGAPGGGAPGGGAGGGAARGGAPAGGAAPAAPRGQ